MLRVDDMATEQLLQRPIYGGVFGEDGQYALASMPCVSRGLYSTRYMVVQPQAGIVLSVSEDKVQALSAARERLHAANDKRALEMPAFEQGELFPDEPLLTLLVAPPATTHIPRRRREIFEQSKGRCHYCTTLLTIDGKWHVEHQLPRALGGGDGGMNLVASCVPCNLGKGDRTAVEFVTQRK